MRKILAAALLAAAPACAGTISLTCARPTGSYKVQVASTGADNPSPAARRSADRCAKAQAWVSPCR
jgi:hypothetical protein